MTRIAIAILGLLLACGLSGQARAQTAFADTLYSFNAGQLTPTPDTGLNGLTYADGHLWLTGFNPPTYQHRLYKMTPDGSSLVSTTVLAEGYHAFYGLTHDGEYLWVTDRDHLAQIDPATGQLTGVQIPVDLYPYLVAGVAYDSTDDTFWIIPQRNGQLQVIMKINRDGDVLESYPNLAGDYTTALAFDPYSEGGPYLWTFSRYTVEYDNFGIMRQFDPATGAFTGVTLDMINRSDIVRDTPLGLTMTDALVPGTVSLAALQAGALNVSDGLDWVVVYDADLTTGQPTSAVTVDPGFIQVDVMQNDTVTVPVQVQNSGSVDLTWSAYVENLDGVLDGPGELGDLLGSVDLNDVFSDLLDGQNFIARGVAFARGDLWVTGRVPGENAGLYRISTAGELLASYPLGGINNLGWGAIASDGDHIFGTDTYTIPVFSIDEETIVDTIVTGSISSQTFAYDPDNRHLYLSGGTGAIKVLDREGEDVRFMVTPYDIQGLAWDDVSPGGPFLWAWVDAADPEVEGEIRCRAVRLDPLTGLSTGVVFDGVDQLGLENEPEAITISRDAVDGKLSLIALQTTAGYPSEAAIVTYDLDAALPPAWIDLTGSTFGAVGPDGFATLEVELHGTMADTTTAAVIKITSNDPAQPLVEIPVTTVMLRAPLSSADTPGLPAATLGAAYPNPFNPSTSIRFALREAGPVNLAVYDVSGRLVRSLIGAESHPAGSHQVTWDGTDTTGRTVSAGVYLYRLQAGSVDLTRRMTLVK